MNVPIRELKANLSRYLRRVQSGEELLITHRGRPVGRIIPVSETDELTEAEAIQRLRQLPWVRAGDPDAFVGSSNPLPYRPGEKTVAELVIENRE